jgi:pyridoxine kinase
MSHILSIQSHVASGYVGNRSAVFPLQRLGCEVSFINTVQFSNHTGYGAWTGEIFSATHIQDVINGLWKNNTMANIDALLSGYQGSAELGEVIISTVKKLRTEHPDVIYCCDPVMGDVGRGIYVRSDAASFIKQHAVQHADILTPNQFELAYLTDREINTLDDVLLACQQLHAKGIKIILVTSLTRAGVSENDIEMLVSTKDGAWVTRTPRFHFERAPSGSGDATAAIFLATYLATKDVVKALEHTTGAIYAIFKLTHTQKRYELDIIKAQDEIVAPSEAFRAEKIAP